MTSGFWDQVSVFAMKTVLYQSAFVSWPPPVAQPVSICSKAEGLWVVLQDPDPEARHSGLRSATHQTCKLPALGASISPL